MKKRKPPRETFYVNYNEEVPTIELDDDSDGKTFGEAKKELLRHHAERIKAIRTLMRSIKLLSKEDCR